MAATPSSSSSHRRCSLPQETLMSANANSSSNTLNSSGITCHCGLIVPLRVATTEINAGRRFFGCHFYPKRCKHFYWVDPEMTRRGVQYALEMQREVHALQAHITLLEQQLRDENGRTNQVIAVGGREVSNKREVEMWIAVVVVLVVLLLYFMYVTVVASQCKI